jgi:MFS family permease
LDTLAPNEEGGRTITGVKWFLICVSLYISAFLYGLDTTIAADVQGPVLEEFGHVELLSWIGSGFPLGSVAVILLAGALYGNFNMKWLFIAGVVAFEVGSVICGAAPDMNALIVGRVLAGAGGTGIYLGCLNYFSFMTSPKERGLYIALIGFHWGIGAVLGPVIGGGFAVSSATWRWAFYINLVIGAVVAPVYVFFLPPIHPTQGKTMRERIVALDMVGFVLVGAAWVLFTVAFSMAGTQWAWSNSRTIALIVIFTLVCIACAVQQYFSLFTTPAARAVPGHLLISRTQLSLVVATGSSNAALFVMLYYIPIVSACAHPRQFVRTRTSTNPSQYFQFVHNDDPIQAAVRLLPFVIVFVVSNVTIGHLLSRIRYYMPIYLISGALIVIGGALTMHYLVPSTSPGVLYGLGVVVAIGSGSTNQVGYSVSTLTVAPTDVVHGISLQNIAQIGGTVVSLVVAGQVFQSYAEQGLSVALASQGMSADEIRSAAAGAQSEVFQRLSGAAREAAIDAIVAAMQKSFIIVIVSGGFMMVAALAMKREKLFGKVVAAG